MENFVFEMTEPSSYKERSVSSQKVNLLVSVGIFALFTIVSDWKYGLILSVFFLIVQYFKSSRWDRFFITQIEYNKERFIIKYKEENQQKEIAGLINDFIIKKETALNRTRTIYLAVYFKGSLILKQFEIGDWNEKMFDKIILLIS